MAQQMVFKNLKTNQKHEIIVGAIEVEVTYPDGRPAAGAAYTLTLEPGGQRKGTLDANGKLNERDVPPGAKATLAVTGAPVIALVE